jgi:hypothetical protein
VFCLWWLLSGWPPDCVIVRQLQYSKSLRALPRPAGEGWVGVQGRSAQQKQHSQNPSSLAEDVGKPQPTTPPCRIITGNARHIYGRDFGQSLARCEQTRPQPRKHFGFGSVTAKCWAVNSGGNIPSSDSSWIFTHPKPCWSLK